MRLIDADALFAEFENVDWYNNADRDEIAERLVLQAPTIDAVSVVRCKECKHRPIKEDANEADYGFNVIAPNEDERCPCLVSDGWYSWMPNDNFYCGFGEREGE